MRDQVVRPDVVVYATGYCQNFDFLDCSYPTPEKASCRDIISPEDPSVSFIGFVRPGGVCLDRDDLPLEVSRPSSSSSRDDVLITLTLYSLPPSRPSNRFSRCYSTSIRIGSSIMDFDHLGKGSNSYLSSSLLSSFETGF